MKKHFTARELEIMMFFSYRYSNKMISEKLSRKESIIKARQQRIKAKFKDAGMKQVIAVKLLLKHLLPTLFLWMRSAESSNGSQATLRRSI